MNNKIFLMLRSLESTVDKISEKDKDKIYKKMQDNHEWYCKYHLYQYKYVIDWRKSSTIPSYVKKVSSKM